MGSAKTGAAGVVLRQEIKESAKWTQLDRNEHLWGIEIQDAVRGS